MTLTEHHVVADPAALGIVPARLDALLQRVKREIDAGILPSCQLALAKDGELVAFTAVGDASTDTRYVIFSASKVFVASGIWILMADGSIDVGKRVADYIPEFAENGKGEITVEQVLLHTAGFPRATMGAPDWWTHEGRIARMATWRLNWEPGTAYEYHPTSAHWVLAELIERVSGTDYRTFLRQRVALPLDLPGLWLGMPEDAQAASPIAPITHVGQPPDPDVLEGLIGVRSLPLTEVTPEALSNFNRADFRALGVPGGGCVTTAADMARFYQGILANDRGIWNPDVLADATSVVRNTFAPAAFGPPANRALGVVVAGDDGKASLRGGFGKTVSPRAFGHDGAGGQIAWADPETGLSLCYLTNGHDADFIRSGRRSTAIGSLAGLCTTPLD